MRLKIAVFSYVYLLFLASQTAPARADDSTHYFNGVDSTDLRGTSDSNNYDCLRSSSETVPVDRLRLEGQRVKGVTGTSEVTYPCWLDVKLARIGQRFARQNFGTIFVAHVFALIALLSDRQTRRVLVLTERSDTPKKAFSRYVATAQHVRLWYHEDILSLPWLQSVQNIRRIHMSVEDKLVRLNSTMGKLTPDNNPTGFWPDQRLWRSFRADMLASEEEFYYSNSDNNYFYRPPHSHTVTFAREGNSRFPDDERFSQKIRRRHLHDNVGAEEENPEFLLNQYTMVVTLWSFMSLPILNPPQLGISPQRYTDRDIQGFAHLWAVLGYVLGVEDRFIVCKRVEEWEACRKFMKDVFNSHLRSQLVHIDFEGQLMIESLMRAIHEIVPPYPVDALLIHFLERHVGIRASALRLQRTPQSFVFGNAVSFFVNSLPPRSRLATWFFNILTSGELQLASKKAFGNPGTNATVVALTHFVT